MSAWASPLHHRLFLQGHNGRTRQTIIDTSTKWYDAGLVVDTVDLGICLSRKDAEQIAKLKINPSVWMRELW